MSLQNFRSICLVAAAFCLWIGLGNASQTGPDPWNYEDKNIDEHVDDDMNIPPDLRITPKTNSNRVTSAMGSGEWFYRRLLSMILKTGMLKNKDESIDILIQMKFNQEQWKTLENYLLSQKPLTEEMCRRSLGLVEQSIHEPSLAEKVILTWTEYIQMQLMEYKDEITWTSLLIGTAVLTFWIWTRMSRRHAIVLIFIVLYSYEVFVSYKEVEQKEIERFIGALNQCKWYIWSSQCDVPKPDILIFLKHMNPLKIGIRMFTTVISEPMITLSDTMKTITHGITDGLWPPFNVLFYGILITFFNVLLFLILIMVLCNYLFNIPLQFSTLGVLGISFQQRNTGNTGQVRTEQPANQPCPGNPNVIDNNMLGRILDVVAQAINVGNNQVQNAVLYREDVRRERPAPIAASPTPMLKRSASTGRLPNINYFDKSETDLRRRNQRPADFDGGGDA